MWSRRAVTGAAFLRTALRERKKPLILGAVVIAFAAALIAWTHASSQRDPNLPDLAVSAPPSRSASAPKSAKAPPSGASRRTEGSGRGTGMLAGLPQFTDAALAGAPQHSVLLTVTSDQAILRLAYAVKGPREDMHRAVNVKSPYRVLTVGRGYGAMAALGAQAGPAATYLTCTITVDGRQRSTRTVRGGWRVAVCLG
jgi:hypothetical protein